jgi:hypothetical protein
MEPFTFAALAATTPSTSWKVSLVLREPAVQWIDTPGYGTESHPIEPFLASFPFSLPQHVVVVIGSKLRESDEALARHLSARRASGDPGAARLVIVRNRSEELSQEDRSVVEDDLRRRFGADASILFTSGRTGEGIEQLRQHLGLTGGSP